MDRKACHFVPIQRTTIIESMHVLIFAGGSVQPGKAVTQAIDTADLVIAADTGADTALSYGCVPAIVVGDFDSLTIPLQQLEELGSQIIRVAAEKDDTDTELAIEVALERGATSITLLGGLGGVRFDHSIANILLLAGYETVPLRIVDGPATCWLLRGPGGTDIYGQSGDLLSLFPLTASASGIHTHNLYYPLHGETLNFGKPRGISNVLTADHAQVTLEQGMLLVVHTTVLDLHE
ncbi:MAG TPA: thiamine diphosphokinase [Ktedonosporobacter sp.]|nr:thiamine diphosphokinase [Ktedonosporobacter sp.]